MVMASAAQPVVQLAENAVTYWQRVVDGKDVLLPRLNEDGHVPAAYHFGMEARAESRLDAHTPGEELPAFQEEFQRRLDALAGELEAYRAQSGYRGSSEHCDQLMMEVSHLSRFLSSCCLEAEQLAGAAPSAAVPEGAPSPGDGGAAGVTRAVRRQLFIWEPLLNEVVVSWEQNSLKDFDKALQALAEPMALPDAERDAHIIPPGYPLRLRGRPRNKVSVFEPFLRPMRTNSIFNVRHTQLMARIAGSEDMSPELAGGLREEMLHFLAMIRNNRFMLANAPSFWNTHRVGLPLIRGRPTSHPFLHDPVDFFKKAVLFHNRTYTVAGGGVDRIYMQVKQLERFYKFEPAGGERLVRERLEACQRGWDENRWDTFTEELLALAERLRGIVPGL